MNRGRTSVVSSCRWLHPGLCASHRGQAHVRPFSPSTYSRRIARTHSEVPDLLCVQALLRRAFLAPSGCLLLLLGAGAMGAALAAAFDEAVRVMTRSGSSSEHEKY